MVKRQSRKVITKKGLEKLKKELKHRTTVLRKEIADKLDEAKGIGDLSENSAYIAALEDYQMNETRINELKELTTNLRVAPSRKGDAIIDIGDKVTLVDTDDSKIIKYTIVGQGEGDPKAGFVSANSVVGGALVGKKKGDTVEIDLPGGKKEYEVKDVS